MASTNTAPLVGICSDGERRSHKCRICPWKLATATASGCAAVVRETLSRSTSTPPAAEAGTQAGSDEPALVRDRGNRFDWPCQACRRNVAQEHTSHTRHPTDCKPPLVEPVGWECPICAKGYGRAVRGHTHLPGECKWHPGPAQQGSRHG